MKATSYPVCGRRHQEAQWQLNHDFLDPTPTLPNPSKPWSKPCIGFTARVERAMVARSNKRNDAHELSISLEEKFSDSANGWKWQLVKIRGLFFRVFFLSYNSGQIEGVAACAT